MIKTSIPEKEPIIIFLKLVELNNQTTENYDNMVHSFQIFVDDDFNNSNTDENLTNNLIKTLSGSTTECERAQPYTQYTHRLKK